MAFQEIDTYGLTVPITKHNYLVRSAAELLDVVPDAFRVTASGRPGPVVVDVPKDVLESRIAARTRAMFERGVEDEVRRALAGPLSATARHVLGLREVAELEPERAIEAIVVRTRRYAAYQRKWMRRIPGLVTVAADRPAHDVAADILEVARARQHLPRHAPAGRGVAGTDR